MIDSSPRIVDCDLWFVTINLELPSQDRKLVHKGPCTLCKKMIRLFFPSSWIKTIILVLKQSFLPGHVCFIFFNKLKCQCAQYCLRIKLTELIQEAGFFTVITKYLLSLNSNYSSSVVIVYLHSMHIIRISLNMLQFFQTRETMNSLMCLGGALMMNHNTLTNYIKISILH